MGELQWALLKKYLVVLISFLSGLFGSSDGKVSTSDAIMADVNKTLAGQDVAQETATESKAVAEPKAQSNKKKAAAVFLDADEARGYTGDHKSESLSDRKILLSQ